MHTKQYCSNNQGCGSANNNKECLVQVGNGIELEAVGLQFEPYLWRPCSVTWDSSRTVVVIKLLRTSALTKRNVTQHNDQNELFYLFCDITVGMISQIMNTLPWFHKSQNCEEIFETIYDHMTIWMRILWCHRLHPLNSCMELDTVALEPDLWLPCSVTWDIIPEQLR